MGFRELGFRVLGFRGLGPRIILPSRFSQLRQELLGNQVLKDSGGVRKKQQTASPPGAKGLHGYCGSKISAHRFRPLNFLSPIPTGL